MANSRQDKDQNSASARACFFRICVRACKGISPDIPKGSILFSQRCQFDEYFYAPDAHYTCFLHFVIGDQAPRRAIVPVLFLDARSHIFHTLQALLEGCVKPVRTRNADSTFIPLLLCVQAKGILKRICPIVPWGS